MKTWLVALAVAVAGSTLALAPLDADARRLGGGKAAGMQRQMPAKPANNATPPQQQAGQQPGLAGAPGQTAPAAAATPATAGAGAAAAAAGKRSWLGPIAGIAAGLGLAALFSHLGLGAELANFVMLALLAVAAFFVVRFLMARFAGNRGNARGAGGMRYAEAGAGASVNPTGALRDAQQAQRTDLQRSALPGNSGIGGGSNLAPATPVAAATALPPGFDAAEFERIAKMLFIRMQAANDSGQVEDLRRFTTPELFASLRLDLQDRGNVAQTTDVVQLDAELADTAQQDGQWIASVRFHGLIRETADGAAAPFDELWHFVKPLAGDREWAVAGIQQSA